MAMGQLEKAEALLRSALVNTQKTEERFLLWRIHASLGHLYQIMDRPDIAEDEISAARTLIEQMAATLQDEELKQLFRQQAFDTL